LKAVFLSNRSIHVLAMLASFLVNEQSKFASIMPVKPTNIIWGLMARCGILFRISILGCLSLSMSNIIVYYLKHDPTYKVILYSNTKSSADGNLLALVKKMLASNSITGDAIALMMKNWLVALFSGSIVSDASTLQVLLATSTTNCGISSTSSLLAIRYGLPPTLVDLLQEMGHVCWGPCSAGNLQDS
jgi:hypothetical protein